MAGLLDWLSKQKDSAMSDYAGLMDNYPNAQKFGSGLINNISQHIPSNADFKSPEAMRDWGTAAALNAPMGLGIKNHNLNFELLKEMALYEANGVAMETPQLQRYNLDNANAQGGSPQSRAVDNGFSTEKYFHGTHQDIKDFKPSNTGALGKGIYSTLRPDTANIYADKLIPWEKGGMTEYGPQLSEPNGNVLPIMLNRTKTHVYDNYRDLPLEGVKPDYFINNGFDSISVKSRPTNTESETSVFDPKNIRSRFAAFDPLRKNSSNILASGLLGSLLLNNLGKDNNATTQ